MEALIPKELKLQSSKCKVQIGEKRVIGALGTGSKCSVRFNRNRIFSDPKFELCTLHFELCLFLKSEPRSDDP